MSLEDVHESDVRHSDIRQSEWYQALAADRQSLEDLGHQIVELAGHLNAANYRFLMLMPNGTGAKDGPMVPVNPVPTG